MLNPFGDEAPARRALPTSWYYGWNVVAATIIFQAITFGTLIYSFTFWVEPWMTEFGASRGEIMVAISAANLAMGLIGPFAGRAVDKIPLRLLISVGATIYGSGLILVSFATSLWQIVALYALVLPIGAVLAGPLSAQALVTRWFSRRRGMALGFGALGTSIGGFFFPVLATTLMAAYDWRVANLVFGIVAITVILPIVWAFVMDVDKSADGADAEFASADNTDGSMAPELLREWKTTSILKSRNFWVLVLTFIPLVVAFNGVQFNLGPIMHDMGYVPGQASIVVSVMAGSMIFGKLFFGSQADRRDHRVLVGGFIALQSVAVFLFFIAPNYSTVLAAAVVFGFSIGGFMPLAASIVASRYGALSFGRVMGLIGPFMALGAMGPFAAGRIRDVSGSYDVVLLAAMGVILMAGLAIPFLRPVPAAAAPSTTTATA